MAIDRSDRSRMRDEELPLEDQPDIIVEVAPEDPADAEMVFDVDPLEGIAVVVEETLLVPEVPFEANLAEFMDEDDLNVLAGDLIEDFDADRASREDWIQTYVDGLELLGLKNETRTEPWPGACGVHHPLLAEALVKFQAEVMTSTFPAQGPVRTVIIGKETTEKREAAARVQADMNYRLTVQMQEYRPEHERMLWGLGLSGNAFKKVYFDPQLDRQVSMYVPAEDIVVPYGASDLESSPRITHVMRKTGNELRRLQMAGFYRDIEVAEPVGELDDIEQKVAEHLGFSATNDERHRLLEIHVELDLPGFEHTDPAGMFTGLALPYVVTVEKSSGEVLAIRRNWEPDDPTYKARKHFVHYGYVPGFGFYHYGLIHLIGAFAKTGTSLLRQLVDAGTLANLPGGFKTKGLRSTGGDHPLAPGEWRDVDVPSGTLKDNFMPLPYKEPSPTLMTLLEAIIQAGQRFANTADMKVSDMSAEAPVGTTLAILERQLKMMSAVQARVHFSMKNELALLKDIIAAYTHDEYDYEPDGMFQGVHGPVKASDYSHVDVIPVSDPNASTMAQRIVQYQAALQLSQTAPDLYNMPLLHRQMLDVLEVKDADKLVPMESDMVPVDPVSENQNVLAGKPVKAFAYQDHQAHIMVHMSAMQDPLIQEMLENHPRLKQLQATMMDHINEHLGMEYRKRIELELGFNLPAQKDELGDDIPMDPEVEARLAPLLAQASQRVLQESMGTKARQKAEEAQQDPLVQLQQMELQIKQMEAQMKQAEIERKAAKDAMDNQLKQQAQAIDAAKALEKARLEREKMYADNRYDAVKSAALMAAEKERDLMKMGADAVKQLSAQHAAQNKGGPHEDT